MKIMSTREKIDKEQLIKTIFAKKGFISQIAAAMRIDIKTVYNYRDRYSAVADALKQARNNFDDTLLDNAEFKLYEAINNNQAWAIRYVLDKKGVSRGYAPNLPSQSDEKITVEVIRE